MRVAMIVRQFPVLSQTFILNQITGLLARGVEVDIYALEGAPEETPKVHPDVETYDLLKRTVYVGPVPTHPLVRVGMGLRSLPSAYRQHPTIVGRSLNGVRYGRPALTFWWFHHVLPMLHRGSYDIIHCQFGTLGLMGMTLREIGFPTAKLVTTFRGFDISRFVRQEGDRVYDRLFQTGDLFLANCEFFRQRAIALGCDPQKIRVHGSGIDCSQFAFRPRHFPEGDRGTVRIVTTGRLSEKKGIEYGIRALAQVATSYPYLDYTIIGEGPLRPDLEQLIQSLQLESCVHLVGWKTRQEIIELLNQAHLFMAPCVTAQDGDQDAPVNVLKEAMAMGLPVISTWHGGIPELVEDGVSGLLVPERDVGAIAQAIQHLIATPDRWPAMGRAGRARVEARYDTHRLNDELVLHYQTLLHRESSPSPFSPPFLSPEGVQSGGSMQAESPH